MIYLNGFTIPDESAEWNFFVYGTKGTCYNTYYPFQIFPKMEFEKMTFETVTIFYGGNGTGKTTLLNIIAEKLRLTRNAVFNRSNFFEKYITLCWADIEKIIPKESRIITSDDVFDDNKPYIHAERGIEIEAAFDMRLINHLTDLIQTSHYNADISTGFSVSDLAGIHRQLIEEAFKDSRKKAEIIAALMGQKITGIEKVEVGDRYDDDYLSDYQIGESEFVSRMRASLASDQLSATDTEESETVTVIWVLE